MFQPTTHMKYFDLYLALKNDIVSGKYGPNQKIPYIIDLARIHKVAKGTAEKAVRLLIKERYAQSVPSQGVFVRPPDSVSIKKHTGAIRSTAICIMRDKFSYAFQTAYFMHVFSSIENALLNKKIRPYIVNCSGRTGSEVIGELNALRIDSAITMEFESDTLRRELEACPLPIVHVDAADFRGKRPFILPNSYHGGQIAAREMLKNGCAKILFLHGCLPDERKIQKVNLQRLEGLKTEAQQLRSMEIWPELIVLNEESLPATVEEALKKREQCSGVIVAGTMLLDALKEAMENKGLLAGKPVISFELNASPYYICRRPVSFCMWDGKAMGETAVRVLLSGKTKQRLYYLPMFIKDNT